MPTPKEIQKLSYEKAVRLEELIDAVEQRIAKSSSGLTKIILKQFLEKLTIEQGKVIAQFNRRTLTLFNRAFNMYQDNIRKQLIKSIVADIDFIVSDNDKFYKKTVNNYSLKQTEIKDLIYRRLGLREDGTLVRQGYMNGLLDDSAIKSDIVRYVQKEMFKSTDVESFRRGLKTFIEGEPEKYGAFQRHYKTFSFDVYAQMNSYTSALIAQKIGLTHFIYNGGIIKTSRKFCRVRNGEVFSTEEAEGWKKDPDLEAIESRDTYNWLIDRGGYNCRHSIDFIADEVAFALRPDLKDDE